MPHAPHQDTDHAESQGLRRLRRRRLLAGSVLVIVAGYLIAGGVAFHTMAEMEQAAAFFFTPPQIEQSMVLGVMTGVDHRLFTFHWWFQKSLFVPVVVAVGAFWIWFKAGRRLVRWEPFCPQCHRTFLDIRCPECGLKNRSPGSPAPNEDAESRTSNGDRSTEEHASDLDLRLVRFGGASILLLSAIHLIVGAVFIQVLPPILPHLMGPGGAATLQNMEISSQAAWWDAHFRWGVLPATLGVCFGSIIWLLANRPLIRHSSRCPACRYDLSGLRCDTCEPMASVTMALKTGLASTRSR